MGNANLDILIPTASAFLGAIIGGSFAIAGIWITEKYRDKRKKRELAVNAAIEDWKIQYSAMMDGKTDGKGINPLDNYIAHHVIVLESLLDKKIDMDEFKKALKRADEITKVYKKRD